ncbi:sulfite reductase, beta subunit (hemoprotein) [Halobacteroides halobius DSM 5150]|uniref:Sulfite reductase, beta subunit (Hemoprotein) n=1 Tax=Halobacteroides halobius (strain ATCC 35273 / DSM 5150 / MD-1) TaxID=748449 RepID=L0KCD7_HALHC|nr:sulfurtransferase TusA family protein [Halobacteroides halobius]AGB42215.1 sulfite reductase, beta subunit (hemoprotein) [Halobacteroides halobius DSM 5150]
MNKQPVFNIPQTVKEDTKEYETEVERFLAGELDAVRFKSRRVPKGVYSQRGYQPGQERYMVRVRIPGGVLTKEQLKRLNQLSKDYGSGYLHVTTRQDIQIHQVKIEDTPQVLFELLEVGLSPRGGGGNTVRNILNAPRAGVNPQQAFDTTPHALALTEYLIKTRSSFNLPRKYKIAFSPTQEDNALATINDLGFIAQEVDGTRGFRVYAAGGMGNEPEVGLLLEEFVTEGKIFHVAEAIKRFFDDYGDRSNKHQARLRFVRKRLGDQEFVKKYQEYLAEVLEEDLAGEEINYYEEVRTKGEDLDLELEADYIYPEAEDGYYSLELRPTNGDLNYKDVEELLDLLTTEEITLRTTLKQGLLIRGVKSNQVASLSKQINNINDELLIANRGTVPVSCKGASTCKLGLCISPNLAQQIKAELSSLPDKLQSVLPQVYISGCPNVCGQHLIGKLGFEGKAKRFNDKLVPHYSLFLGGNIEQDNSCYGDKTIDIPAKRIPDFLEDLARMLVEDLDYNKEQFNQYLEAGGAEKIINLAARYTSVPNYEEDPAIYKDWGQEQDFSLAGRGPGECGAGVMDIIQLDIDTAKSHYQAATKDNDNEQLYQAIVNVARALLIVRGVDTDKDRVILKEFETEFIDSDLVDNSYVKLLDAAIDYKLGDIDDLLQYQEQVAALVNRVEKLYNSLNAKLEFDLEEEVEENKETTEDREEKLADLRGVECPMNFVKAKVAISPLDEGDILEIYLDEGEPIANVPQSLAKEGHEILSKEQTKEGHYILLVKKQ